MKSHDGFERTLAEILAAPLTVEGEIAIVTIRHVKRLEQRLAETERAAARAVGRWRRRRRQDKRRLGRSAAAPKA